MGFPAKTVGRWQGELGAGGWVRDEVRKRLMGIEVGGEGCTLTTYESAPLSPPHPAHVRARTHRHQHPNWHPVNSPVEALIALLCPLHELWVYRGKVGEQLVHGGMEGVDVHAVKAHTFGTLICTGLGLGLGLGLGFGHGTAG
jgi:hypothetical protein